MVSFRFEYYENVITKHNFKSMDWTQAAKWSFMDKLTKPDVTIARIRTLDDDSVEIIKRIDQNKNLFFKLGLDQRGLYQRVIINRKDKSVAVDRMDVNWWFDKPFLGRRDLFMPDPKNPKQLSFIRHHVWLHKLLKFNAQLYSNVSALQYKRAFKRADKTEPTTA